MEGTVNLSLLRLRCPGRRASAGRRLCDIYDMLPRDLFQLPYVSLRQYSMFIIHSIRKHEQEDAPFS